MDETETKIIAARELIFHHPDGTETPAGIEIKRPVQNELGIWECEIRVFNGVAEDIQAIQGDDSLQSLNLALGFLTADLAWLSRNWNGQFLNGDLPPFELGKI